jgi:hypothetical protein
LPSPKTPAPGRLCTRRKKLTLSLLSLLPYQVWYVIPVESLESKKIIRLYPRGKRKSGTQSASLHLPQQRVTLNAYNQRVEKNRRSASG